MRETQQAQPKFSDDSSEANRPRKTKKSPALPTRRNWLWQFIGRLGPLVLLFTLGMTLWGPVIDWFAGDERYHREVLEEWIQEARIRRTLADHVDEYIDRVHKKSRPTADKFFAKAKVGFAYVLERMPENDPRRPDIHALYQTIIRLAEDRYHLDAESLLTLQNDIPNKGLKKYLPSDSKSMSDLLAELITHRQEEIKKRRELHIFLKSLCDPVTKIYSGQLPLFPVIYRMEVQFADDMDLEPLVWDSELPRREGQYRELDKPIEIRNDEAGKVHVQMLYRLRVETSHQDKVRTNAKRHLWFTGGATLVLALVVLLSFVAQEREREQREGQLRAEQRVNEAERRRLEEEVRRQEAEKNAREAERVNLELKSQLWANIGIMAGSYAHNIKNLLIRPNDLLNRCLESGEGNSNQGKMLQEVQVTLHTVTERLQQILQTVRRDPTQSERVVLDLNSLLGEMQHTWGELAHEKWKLTIHTEPSTSALLIEGDRSHLQQAIENLLFNARDATFEMRNHLRERARKRDGVSSLSELNKALAESKGVPTNLDRKQALIAAASWQGEVHLRTYSEGDRCVLEIQDNGIGMSEEVRQRCTETHFSTKRNNALFAGFSAGMGLGLSFIMVILEHHHAQLMVESEWFQGATFRMSFPRKKSTASPQKNAPTAQES
ncbi:MAG: ATP-binding protein [Gemmataceae bacterium]